MIDPDKMTWRCDVCGDERPDAKISVHTDRRELGRAQMAVNIKYCNDRADCEKKAPGVADERFPS